MIYPQYITGKYRTIKNYSSVGLLLFYFLMSWIRWDRGEGAPGQAIFMDLPNRKAYLFGIEIWPEELYYLTGILILAAFGLFFVTALFGRIWCGYTCPHTVFVDLFVKVEKFFQGDRNARMQLDASPMDSEKFKKKLLTHLCWIGLGFSFAFGWVCYFYDAPTLVSDLWNFKVTGGGLTWLLGLTLSTYLFGGFVRERVCLYMCPYGRFQSAMLDNNSTVVTYHDWRGEPRGKYDPNDKKLGDCIDCGKCVVVCPMGIDIRNGLQLACIGCGLCVDACNSVMNKLGRPEYLIGYDSVNSANAKKDGQKYQHKIFSSKTIIFLAVFSVVSAMLLLSLLHKPVLNVSILHDRAPLYNILPDGSVRNGYTLKLQNRTQQEQEFEISIDGIEGAELKLQGNVVEYSKNAVVKLKREEDLSILIYIKASINEGYVGERKIRFIIKNLSDNKLYSHETIFISGR